MLVFALWILWTFPAVFSSAVVVKEHEGYPHCNLSHYRADYFYAVSCLGIVRVSINQPDVETMNKRIDELLETLYANHKNDPCIKVRLFHHSWDKRNLTVLRYDLHGGDISYWLTKDPATNYEPVIPFSTANWTSLGLKGYSMEMFNSMSEEERKRNNAICEPELSAFDDQIDAFDFFGTVISRKTKKRVTADPMAYHLEKDGSCKAEHVHAKREFYWYYSRDFLDLSYFKDRTGSACWNIDTKVRGAAFFNEMFEHNALVSRQSTKDPKQYFLFADIIDRYKTTKPRDEKWCEKCFLRQYRHDLLETYNAYIMPISGKHYFLVDGINEECPVRNESLPCKSLPHKSTLPTTTTTTTSTTSTTTTTTTTTSTTTTTTTSTTSSTTTSTTIPTTTTKSRLYISPPSEEHGEEKEGTELEEEDEGEVDRGENEETVGSTSSAALSGVLCSVLFAMFVGA